MFTCFSNIGTSGEAMGADGELVDGGKLFSFTLY